MKGISLLVKLLLVLALAVYLKQLSPRDQARDIIRQNVATWTGLRLSIEQQDHPATTGQNASADTEAVTAQEPAQEVVVVSEVDPAPTKEVEPKEESKQVSDDDAHKAEAVLKDEVKPQEVKVSDAEPATQQSLCTLAIIKPDAVEKGFAHDIVTKVFQSGDLQLVSWKRLHFSRELASEFYTEHSQRAFFPELIDYITRSDSIAYVLKGQDVVPRWRGLMGPTNPEVAKSTSPESIRALYGTDITHNAVHGSDSAKSAKREITLLFGGDTHTAHCLQ